jgi:hypothetical protein
MLTVDSFCRMLTAVPRDAPWSDSGGVIPFWDLDLGSEEELSME